MKDKNGVELVEKKSHLRTYRVTISVDVSTYELSKEGLEERLRWVVDSRDITDSISNYTNQRCSNEKIEKIEKVS
jgi:hypothetical protein